MNSAKGRYKKKNRWETGRGQREEKTTSKK